MATFKPPQRKKNANATGYKPLPIPISTITRKAPSISEFNFYRGYLTGDCVAVKKKGDASHLHQQGYFGKLLKVSGDDPITNANDEDFANCSKDIAITDEESDPKIQIKYSGNIYSQLSLEESFFLSYALGCLFVFNAEESSLDLKEQWNTFCNIIPNFPIKYAVYHYFRSKGWVPKEGIRYGSDYLLYRKGPQFYHASYIVNIQVVDETTLKPIDFNGMPSREFSWLTISGLLRLATTVSKEVLLCCVIVPRGLTKEELSSPLCIKKFKIHERLFSRWVSNKEREKELNDIDCDF